MSEKQYGHDDARDYEPYFSRHLMAMTTEDLHSKGEIACELAYRDQRIAELLDENNAYEKRERAYIAQIDFFEAENARLREAARDAVLEWREVIRGDFDGVTGGNTDDVTERLGALLGGGE